MRENYKKAFDKLAPKRSDGELLKAVLGKAENNMEKKKLNKKAIIVPVAAALALTVGTVGVAAALNAEHLRGIFGGNESITENIHNSVFEDSDEHVKLTVEEYLSDGQCTYLTVHYQALDEEGAEWLAQEDFTNAAGDMRTLSVQPKFREEFGKFYAVSHSLWANELTELTTETDKYFCVYFEANGRHYGTDQAKFKYPLTDGAIREAVLDVGTNVEEKWFELKDTESPSEFYVPKYLVLSEMSFSIYGENTGAYVDNSVPEKGWWSFTSLMTHEEKNADAVNDISFVLDDGSIYELENYWSLCSAVAHEDNRYTDINIASGCFIEHDWSDGEYRMEFNNPDIDRVVGLQIGDVCYELSAE